LPAFPPFFHCGVTGEGRQRSGGGAVPNPCSHWYLGRAPNRLGIRGFGLLNGDKPLSHQAAVVVEETAAAVELDSGIAVSYLEMEGLPAKLERGRFGEVQKLSGDTLPAMGGLDEEFIDPGAFAAIFEAEIEADDEVGHRDLFVASQIDDAILRIAEKFREIISNDGFAEWNGPRIVALHVAHQGEQCIEVGGSGALDGDGHERSPNLSE
jgi:hypothetical protein